MLLGPARSPANQRTAAHGRLHFIGGQRLEQMSRTSFRSLGNPPIPQPQRFPDRFASGSQFGDLALNGFQNLNSGCAYLLARRPTSLANSKKRSKLFERKPEPKGVLNQPHSLDGGFTVDAIAGRSTRGLRHETNPLVVPDRIGAHARPFRKLAYLQQGCSIMP